MTLSHKIAWKSGLTEQLVRQDLVSLILECQSKIILIEAPAGMGKSTFLRQIAEVVGTSLHFGSKAPETANAELPALWDIGPHIVPDPLPESFVAGEGRLVIAKRPETVLPGLSRAVIYGKVAVLGTSDLLVSRAELEREMPPRQAAQFMARSGGWPMMLPFAQGHELDPLRAADVLGSEWLRHMSAPLFVALGEVLAGRQIELSVASMLAPLVKIGDHGKPEISIPALEAPLAQAYAQEYTLRVGDQERIVPLAVALRTQGHPAASIRALQSAGRFAEALQVLESEDGFFFYYRHGPVDFAQVLSGFRTDFASANETLVICRCLEALKGGDLARTRQLVINHFGAAAAQAEAVFGNPLAYSRNFRFFRVLMLIYEDVFVSDALFDQLYRLIGDLPLDAHLARGSFFNSLLEFYIRRRRFAEAEDVATRAWDHYAAAKVPMLQFYIRLHQSVMRLMQGDAHAARRFADDCAAVLAASGFESPSDSRLLALLRACVDYEGGQPELLARFLSFDLDEFAHGEIWPTVIDLALQYGSQALGEHFSTSAARAFLDRWRVFRSRDLQFQSMIEIRDAIILQNGNRWQEAAGCLSAIPTKIGKDWVLSPANDLKRLQARDDIAMALAWLRQAVFEAPKQTHLDTRLLQMLSNLQLTGRQKVCVNLWLAYVHSHRRDHPRSRSLLQSVLERADRLGSVAPLAEEKFFLNELLQNSRVRDLLQVSASARHILKRLTGNGLAGAAPDTQSGLSRREIKVVLMIAEGSSSKFIAHSLGISEATVKFHLGNVYRKLNCKGRREAIDSARVLRIVP